MTLRMHPTSASRWAQLAASRHLLDLTAAEAAEKPTAGRTKQGDRGRRRRDEHARIQAQVDAIGGQRVSARR
jgi:hypothetical protein